MRKKILVLIYLFIWILLLLPLWPGERLAAQTSFSSIPIVDSEGVLQPDWENLSFSTISPSTGEGSFNLSDLAEDSGYSAQSLIDEMGYDPSRSWRVGTPIENILKLGDINSDSTLSNWTLGTISKYTDIDFSVLKLADFGLLKSQSLEELVTSVPGLGTYSLKDVTPFYDLIESKFGVSTALSFSNLSLEALTDDFTFGTIKLEDLDLTNYDLTSIPGIEDTAFGDFLDWKGSFLGDIPGLSTVPIASFLLGIAGNGFLGKVDVVYGEKEANRINTVTGSYQEGFKVPCKQKNCAHIELTDAVPTPVRALHGKQWISGNSQKVKGGNGVLGSAFGGKEPTGRHPFGDAFKVVLTKTIESEGRAEFSIYFRVCGRIFFAKTCSPYIIGPFPWFSHKEKDYIFVGIDGIDSKVPTNLPPLPSLSTIPPEIADKLPRGYDPEGNDSGYYPDGGDGGTSGNLDDDCATYKGVNLGALRRGISNQESRGSGDYLAVGIWVEADNGRNHGRALGKYQFMSYREDVEAVFKRKSGGMNLLQRIEANSVSESEIKSKLLHYFPAEIQEQLRTQWFKKLIDLGYSKGFRGDKLIQYIGGWHNGGERSPALGYGAITVKEYNKESKKVTKCGGKSEENGGEGGKGTCTGKLIKPTQGVKTSGFGSRINPVTGKRSNHNGVDIAAPVGTSILAADGGEVIFVNTGCQVGNLSCGGRFGNYIKIRHCNGWITVYAHLSKTRVKLGQKISQGQHIGDMGTTGSSTGSHLHFETHINGRRENPEKYLPKL